MIAFLITLAMGLCVICSTLEAAAKSQRRYERRIRYQQALRTYKTF